MYKRKAFASGRLNEDGKREMTMSDWVRYGRVVRPVMIKAFSELGDAVRVTMGPKGRSVQIKSTGAPKVTRDGVTIVNSINFEDDVMRDCANVVRKNSNDTNEIAGDGTTCMTLLIQELFTACCKYVEEGGMCPEEVYFGIKSAIECVQASLTKRAKKISTYTEIAQVATTSAHGDKEIGFIVAYALKYAQNFIGKDRRVFTIVEEACLDTIQVDRVSRMMLDSGYISTYENKWKEIYPSAFSTSTEIENPKILILNFVVLKSNVEWIVKNMTFPRLLIVADHIKDDALNALIQAQSNGIEVFAIKALEKSKSKLHNLGNFVGGKVLTGLPNNMGDKYLSSIVGTCKKVYISKDYTVILAGRDDQVVMRKTIDEISSHTVLGACEWSNGEMEETEMLWTSRLKVLKMAGEVEKKVTKPLKVAIAALEEGILPGGGVALLYASKELDHLQTECEGQKVGVEILQKVLKIPVYTIASNAGFNGSVVVDTLLKLNDHDLGFDASTGQYVNMIEAGIIDSLKATSTAFHFAAAMASLLMSPAMTVETKTYPKKKSKKKQVKSRKAKK